MSDPESPPRLTLPVGPRDHIQGPADAPLTLVEYGDYECPFCGKAYPIVKHAQRRLGDRLRFVFRNFPITNSHPHAARAAEAAEAAAAQGQFWEMHDLLYEHQQDLEDAAPLRYAREAGADVGEVEDVLARGVTRARVKRDLGGALRSGANGTPAFFVNGERYDGSWDYEPFSAHIRAVLDRR